MSPIITFLVALVVSALVIYIVSRLNLGLTVNSFTTAVLAALVIAIVAAILGWLLGLLGIGGGAGLWGAIVNLIVAAVVLLLSGRIFKGLVVKGFTGAIIAAIAIAVVGWIISWLLGLFGIVV